MRLLTIALLVLASCSHARTRRDDTVPGPQLGESTKSAGADPSRPPPDPGDTRDVTVPVRSSMLTAPATPPVAPPAPAPSGAPVQQTPVITTPIQSTPVTQPPDLAPAAPPPQQPAPAPQQSPAAPSDAGPGVFSPPPDAGT